MVKKIILLFSLFVTGYLFSSKSPLHGFEMGVSAETFLKQAADISNKESWEETRFLLNEPTSIFGQRTSKTELAFWKDRLYEVKITLPLESWSSVRENLDKVYGSAWSIDTSAAEKSGSWGETKNGVFVFQQSGIGTVVIFTDEEQKAFRFSDLFQGMLLYIIITIAGLFVLNFLLGWLITSRCKRCGSFGMKYQQLELSGLKDQSSELLTTSLQHDVTYAFRCSKCGHTRKDKYSGFWSYLRSKD